MDDLLRRREAKIRELSGLSGSDILKKAITNATRTATILLAEGQVRLRTGHFVLPEELDAKRRSLSAIGDE